MRANVENGVALGASSVANRKRGALGFVGKTSTTVLDDTYASVAEYLGNLEQYQKARAELEKYPEVARITKELYTAYPTVYDAQMKLKDAYVALKTIDRSTKPEAWNTAYQAFLDAAKAADKASDVRMAEYWKTQDAMTKEEYAKQKAAYDQALLQIYNAVGAYRSTQGAVSVGNEEKGYTRQITGVAAASENTDAVNLLQLKDAHQTMETTSPAVFVLDDGTPVHQSHVDGQYYKAADLNAHNEPKSKDARPVATDQLGKRALTTAGHDLSKPVGLTNVAEGVSDYDAVNVKQLKEYVGQASGAAVTRLNQQVVNNANRIDRLDRRLNRGLAAQAALSGLHKPYNLKKLQVTAALGFYRSDTALAIGAGYKPSERFAVSAGLATNTKDTSDLSGNVGVSLELF